jgi:hypothetical protein
MGLSKGYPQAWLHQLHPMLASHRACAWVQAAPARPALAQQQLRQPMPGPQQLRAGVFAARTGSGAASSAWVGTRTVGGSPMCSNRASRSASRRSVLTRSPGGRSSLTAPLPHRRPRPPGVPGPARTRSGQPPRPRPPGRAATSPSSGPPRWPAGAATTTPAQGRCPALQPRSTGHAPPGQPTYPPAPSGASRNGGTTAPAAATRANLRARRRPSIRPSQAIQEGTNG